MCPITCIATARAGNGAEYSHMLHPTHVHKHTYHPPLELTRTAALCTTRGGCMQADCGKPGQPCCYSGDPTVEAERCGAGLACISQRLGYGDRAMYHKLLADPAGLKSKELMGVCR